MPGFTVPLGFPYPVAGDPANGPQAIKDLANAVDAGVTSTETQLANIQDPPVAWVGAAPAVIPDSIGTVVIFTIEFFDNAGMLNLVSNNTEFVITSAGLYMISGEVGFEPNGNGGRQLEILVNGVAQPYGFSASGPPTTLGQGWSANTSLMRSMVVGDRVSFRAGHTAGVAISTTGLEGYVFRVSG